MILKTFLLIAIGFTAGLVGVHGVDLGSTLTGLTTGGLDIPSIIKTELANVGMIENCATMVSFKDADLGTIDAAPDVYCKNVSTLRVVPGLTCCAPQTPEAQQVRFQLYDPASKKYKLLDWRNKTSPLDANKPVHFFAHGYLEPASVSPYFIQTVEAMAALGYQSIGINWDRSNNVQYFQAAANLRLVGMMTGYAIHNWGIADITTMAGMSLGAQMVGEVGKQVKKLSNGSKKVSRCIGLDPAGPSFDGGSDDMRLTKDDCAIVDVVHSSSGSLKIPVLPSGFVNLALQQLGTAYKSGHCDYWINCGHFQPNCPESVLDFANFLTMTGTLEKRIQFVTQNAFYTVLCAHGRAAMVYVSSAAKQCDYKTEVCTDCEKGFVLDGSPLTIFLLPPFDNLLSCKHSGDGYNMPPFSQCAAGDNKNFYVSSDGKSPYCNTAPLTAGSVLTQFGRK